MRTRSSRAASSGGEGARACTDAAGAETGVGCAAARSMAASMSPLVTRPSLPLPGTAPASTPDTADNFRTDGASGVSLEGFGAAAAGAAAALTAAGCGAGSALVLGALGGAALA